jgi:CRISPR-associated protein Csm3
MQLKKKIFKKYKMTILTGIHVGDSKESVQIGGVDSPVVRRKDNNQPYIPGSSLKGKIRSLLEIAMGENANSQFNNYSKKAKHFERLFGSKNYPARIIVRDADLTAASAKQLKDSDFTDMPYTEIKFENVINRIKGTAEHPRQIERVPAGAEFDVEFIINIVDTDEYKDGNKVETAYKMSDQESYYTEILKSGISLLEDDYLGGSGTRGYGRVKFTELEVRVKTTEEYLKNAV